MKKRRDDSGEESGDDARGIYGIRQQTFTTLCLVHFTEHISSWLNMLAKQTRCTVEENLSISKMCSKDISSTGRNNTLKRYQLVVSHSSVTLLLIPVFRVKNGKA